MTQLCHSSFFFNHKSLARNVRLNLSNYLRTQAHSSATPPPILERRRPWFSYVTWRPQLLLLTPLTAAKLAWSGIGGSKFICSARSTSRGCWRAAIANCTSPNGVIRHRRHCHGLDSIRLWGSSLHYSVLSKKNKPPSSPPVPLHM